MTTEAVPALGPVQVLVAASLIAIAGGISLALRLGLLRQILVASLRTVLQLLALGLVLGWVFALERWDLVLAMGLVMILIAAHAAVRRSQRRLRGDVWLAYASLLVSCTVTMAVVMGAVVPSQHWYDPQYVIPLLGMILGNGLTGLSLGMDSLTAALQEGQEQVEQDLALGATPWEAARGPVAEGVRRAMIPILNSMSVVGLVSLPGMMTGQILQGGDPMTAVGYQIVVMFMICGAVAISSTMLCLLIMRRSFDDQQRLRQAPGDAGDTGGTGGAQA